MTPATGPAEDRPSPPGEASPEISVIVPTRNRAPYLDRCLSSLARQRPRGAFEVIVVDNGSTDETAVVVDRWRAVMEHCRTVTESRVGLSHAKNTGVRSARGSLLLFTDDDVVVADGWVEAYRQFFERRIGDRVIAGGPIVPIPEDLGEWPRWFTEEALDDAGRLDLGSERPLRAVEWVWGANMAIPAAVFREAGDWDVSLGRRGDQRGTFEDTDYQDRLKEQGGDVWFCPSAVVHHRVARERAAPRRLLRTAYCRGRDSVAIEKARGEYRAPASVRSGAAELAWIVGRLAAWLARTAVFRLSLRPEAFAAAHRSAWLAGRASAELLDARDGAVIARVYRLMPLAVRLTLRAAPRSTALQ